MKVSITSPYRTFGGTYKSTDLIFRRTGIDGELVASAKIRQTNPDSPDQRAARRMQKDAVEHWAALTREQRMAWNRFAQQYGPCESHRSGRSLCREAARMRLFLGMAPRADGPRFCIPPRVAELSCEPAGDPGTYTFRVVHAIEAASGYWLQIKITPPPPTAARTPRAKDARCICGVGPQSAMPLPPSGGTVTFSNTRFALEPGWHVGVVATIIREEEGLASVPASCALVR